jgi:hypothetical protein
MRLGPLLASVAALYNLGGADQSALYVKELG